MNSASPTEADRFTSRQPIHVRPRRPIVILFEVLLCSSAFGVAALSAIHVFQGAPRTPVESVTFLFVVAALLLALARPSAAAGHQGASSGVPGIWLGVSVFVAFCLYAPSLALGFLSDDFVLLRLSREGAFVMRADWFFRPVPLLLWGAFQTLRVPPPLFHGANVVFHGINAFLVALVGVRLGMTRSAGIVAGALFLTFPAAPEAVAWLSGMQDVLLTSATLAAVLLAYHANGQRRTYVYVALAVLVALGCKETAVCLPLLMALALWPLTARRHHQQRAVFIAGLLVLAYGGVRLVHGVAAGYMQPLSKYLVKQLIVVSYGTLASPWRSNPVRTPMLEWASATFVLGLTCASALFAWHRRAPSFERAVRLAPWAAVAVAPVFTYFTVSASLEWARYLYLPEAGWALLLASMLDDLVGRVHNPRAVMLAVAIAIVGASAPAVERELAIWRQVAVLRDQVVAEAQDAQTRERCTATRFVDAPDSVEGAYVFRNGLQDAVADVPTTMPVSKESCTLRWTGTRFTRPPP